MKFIPVLGIALAFWAADVPRSLAAPPTSATARTAGSQGSSTPAPAATAGQPRSAQDTIQYLPDRTVLARVADRVIRVIDYRGSFFSSDAQVRPKPDSAGLVTFLNVMIDKEVLGLTARQVDPPFGFEERAEMRRHTNTVLDNVLYTRMVIDSIVITEEDFRSIYPQYERTLRLRSILFNDRALAEKVRLDLLRGRIAWREAVRRYSRSPNLGPDGDMGWVQRQTARGGYGLEVFALKVGSISTVIQDIEGFRLIQCMAERPVPRPPLSFMRPLILEDLRAARRAPLVERMYQRVREYAKVSYDSTNIRWAAAQFKRAFDEQPAPKPGEIDMTSIIPDFSPADTGRVLLRTPTRSVTLNQFLYEFSSIPSMFRQKLLSIEPFIFALDGPALAQERIAYAREIGLEKDPEALKLIEQRREELMVEHIYQDSVTNRLVVTPDMRRAFYKAREKEFVSFQRVRFAQFVRPDSLSAVALMARFQAGERPEAILAADSLRGDDTTGAILEQQENEAGDMRRVLFEELRPGQWTRFGPDKTGQHLVMYVLHHEPSRQLAYDEVQTIVDESVQNIEAERLLKELLARRRTHYVIESHPELLPRVRLSDPKFDLDAGRTAARQ
jgi:hypothetical protein